MTKNLNKNRVFRFNRRIRNLTNYPKRLNLLKGKLTRVVIRKSNNNTLVSFVDYKLIGDKILIGAKSNALKQLGSTLHSGNLTSAYLTGYLAGKRLLKLDKNKEVILDMGLQRKIVGSRIFAGLKGVLDSGVNVRVKDSIFPSKERLEGEHLKTKDAKLIVEKVMKKIDEVTK